MTEWEIANAAAQLAREAQLKAYYAARTAAGETPSPTQSDTDHVTATDAQTGAEFQIPVSELGGSGAGATSAGTILVASMEHGPYTHTANAVSLASYNLFDEWTIHDPMFGWNPWNGDSGILVETNGVLELFFHVMGLKNDEEFTANPPGIHLNIYGESQTPPVFSTSTFPDISTGQNQSPMVLRVPIIVANYELDPDPDSQRNVDFNWTINMTEAASDGAIKYTKLRAYALWTPLG